MVNNAANDQRHEIDEVTEEYWDNRMTLNLKHYFFTIQSVKNSMIKNKNGGSIINLSSTAGIHGFDMRTPYAASKWAVIGITKSLAIELGEHKIRVNAICPGSVSGDRMKRVIAAKAKSIGVNPNKIKKDYESMVSLKTFVDKEDIAKTAIFLISDDANKISGQIMTVDGNTERMN